MQQTYKNGVGFLKLWFRGGYINHQQLLIFCNNSQGIKCSCRNLQAWASWQTMMEIYIMPLLCCVRVVSLTNYTREGWRASCLPQGEIIPLAKHCSGGDTWSRPSLTLLFIYFIYLSTHMVHQMSHFNKIWTMSCCARWPSKFCSERAGLASESI